MLKEEVARGRNGRVVLMDTITKVARDDDGSIVISGSHGGTSSAAFALQVPLALAVFNDAGVGKDEAGLAALALLQACDVAAATVSHASARIGDARDTWDHGIVSHVNEGARRLGLAPGSRLREIVQELIER